MDLVERVARAIFFDGGEQNDEQWKYMQKYHRENARSAARNAIAATGVEELADALDWAIAEIEGRTRYPGNNVYDCEEQQANAHELARTALAKFRGEG